MGSKARVEKDRLDHLLVTLGLAQSRDVSARMILAGEVMVNGSLVDKPAKAFPLDATVEVLQQSTRYVSRGGDKLAAALDACSINPGGMICLDVGCSTGGFTDCLLQRGAARVYAVDVGYGQFDWRLRKDPRVVLIERHNIRYLDRAAIAERVDLVVIDVSFISLTKVFSPIIKFLTPGATVIALVKPQFEVGKGQVGRGGIVRDESQRQKALQRVVHDATSRGLQTILTLDCPIKGKKGNHEILAIFGLNATIHDMKEGRNQDSL